MIKYKDWQIRLVVTWFAASTTALFLALVFSVYLATPKLIRQPNPERNLKAFAALPQLETAISDEIVEADARGKIIEDFFKSYKAPLAEYGKTFIAVADKYQLDWRLLPAIAMQESSGGKKVIRNSHNPFGYGIYGTLTISFKSWEEAIEAVGKALRENYLDQGLKNPYQIMTKYTPPSVPTGAWATAVSSFMAELH